jgi:tetratricopeptide (TPR) repeat protein
MQEGKVDEAISRFQKAIEIKPTIESAHNNLGNALMQKGRLDEAITQYQAALQIKPDYAESLNNLGNALLQMGKVDEATAQFQKAIQINPDLAQAHNNLGTILLQKGRGDEAVSQYQAALQIKPDYADARNNLGNAFLQSGRLGEAISQYQQALQINPADPMCQCSLAWLLATAPEAALREGARAVSLARQADTLTGGVDPVILRTLAAACAETGSYGLAAVTARRALGLAAEQMNDALAAALQREIKLYEADKPTRDGTTEGSAPTGRVAPP